MHKTFPIPTLLSLLLIGLGTAVYTQAASLEDSVTHQFSAAEFERVEVSNINGSITCTGDASDQIELIAIRKVRAGSDSDAESYLEQIHIDIKPDGSTLKVETKLPRKQGGFWQWVTGSQLNATVEYQLRVPAGMNVGLDSVNGSISADALEGSVKIETVNGRIHASNLHAKAQMETVNGSIECSFASDASFESLSFETVNGSIKVKLPANAAFDLDIETVNGGIHCDFDLPADAVHKRRELHARINGGGPRVKLETVNGSASVKALEI